MKGLFVWVWEDGPGKPVDDADGYIVRAANGNGVTANEFNFETNYGRWRTFCQENRKAIVPWTYLYPNTNGADAANALLMSAGDADEFIADIEQAVPTQEIGRFLAVMHERRKRVGFTSYPTRQQAMNQGVPFDDCMNGFDFFVPQVYYDSQAREFGRATFRIPVEPAVSPPDNNAWREQVAQYLPKFGTVSVWRYGDPADLNLSGLEAAQPAQSTQPSNKIGAQHVKIVGNSQVDTSQPLHNLILEVGELDNNGDGWWHLNGENGFPAVEFNRLAFVEATGSDPGADGAYWSHEARVQDRDGYALLSVTGGAKGGTALVRVAYYGIVADPTPAS